VESLPSFSLVVYGHPWEELGDSIDAISIPINWKSGINGTRGLIHLIITKRPNSDVNFLNWVLFSKYEIRTELLLFHPAYNKY